MCLEKDLFIANTKFKHHISSIIYMADNIEIKQITS